LRAIQESVLTFIDSERIVAVAVSLTL